MAQVEEILQAPKGLQYASGEGVLLQPHQQQVVWNKWYEVIVRGTKVQYSKSTISVVYGLQEVEDSYQSLVENMDEQDLEVLRDSLCVEGTKWHVAQKVADKTMMRMQLKHVPKVWYQFLKHYTMPTPHNESVNKEMVVFNAYEWTPYVEDLETWYQLEEKGSEVHKRM